MSLALRARAEKLSAALPPLLIDAERVAQTVWQGVHGRRRAGVGENFWQFRRYDVGDPAEDIDWRQSARSDKLFVRMNEWEAVQSVCLWADASGSMQYASEKKWSTKASQAQLLMLALASLLLRGGEKPLWSDGQNYKALNGKAALERVAIDAMTVGESLPPFPPTTRHAHMVLASDFLLPDHVLQQRMHAYAAQHMRGVLLHVIDPLEESFDLDGRVELLGVEGEEAYLVPNAAALRQAYIEKFQEHQARLQHIAKSAGWFYARHITSGSASRTLLRLYQYLAG